MKKQAAWKALPSRHKRALQKGGTGSCHSPQLPSDAYRYQVNINPSASRQFPRCRWESQWFDERTSSTERKAPGSLYIYIYSIVSGNWDALGTSSTPLKIQICFDSTHLGHPDGAPVDGGAGRPPALRELLPARCGRGGGVRACSRKGRSQTICDWTGCLQVASSGPEI